MVAKPLRATSLSPERDVTRWPPPVLTLCGPPYMLGWPIGHHGRDVDLSEDEVTMGGFDSGEHEVESWNEASPRTSTLLT